MTHAEALAMAATMTEADFPTVVYDDEPDDAQIERLIEAGRRGRPSLSEPGATSPQITVRLPERELEAIRKHAAAEGMTVSKWARRALAAAAS
jgi:predicted DNA binding CopG/RHH family protein